MKKSISKMQLKKRSISKLNTTQVNGGLPPTTSLISAFCPTRFYYGEDLCFSPAEK